MIIYAVTGSFWGRCFRLLLIVLGTNWSKDILAIWFLGWAPSGIPWLLPSSLPWGAQRPYSLKMYSLEFLWSLQKCCGIFFWEFSFHINSFLNGISPLIEFSLIYYIPTLVSPHSCLPSHFSPIFPLSSPLLCFLSEDIWPPRNVK